MITFHCKWEAEADSAVDYLHHIKMLFLVIYLGLNPNLLQEIDSILDVVVEEVLREISAEASEAL